jgi:hypothetical protein
VDVVTKNGLKSRIRERVLAEVVYIWSVVIQNFCRIFWTLLRK